MITTTKSYPLLTMETLLILERLVEARCAILDDYLLLEHYLADTGNEGSILKIFAEHDTFSFEEYLHVIKGHDRVSREKSAALTGILLGHIHFLMRLVEDGEQIY